MKPSFFKTSLRRVMSGYLLASVALGIAPSDLSINEDLQLPVVSGAEAGEQPIEATFEAIRDMDLRLASIGYRLARANVGLCRAYEPGTGVVPHSLAQYGETVRSAARRHFSFQGRVAVLGTVQGSSAALAGVRPDDTLLAIGPVKLDQLPGNAPTATITALHAALSTLRAERLEIQFRRGDKTSSVTVKTENVCRTRFELELSDDANARADGVMVQMSSKLFEDYTDDQVAVLVAHELAHNILRHRDRLGAENVTWGIFAELGRSANLFRQTEVEADVLAVSLLANAGYPPGSAALFWQVFGPSHAAGLFRSRTHPDWRDRVATMQAQADAIERQDINPKMPPVLGMRDQPLNGNWRALLVRRAR